MLHWIHHKGELVFLQERTPRKSVSLFLSYYLAQLCGEAIGQKAHRRFGALFGRPHASEALKEVIECFELKNTF